MLFRKKSQATANTEADKIIEAQWGGYYTSKQDGGFGFFRLLDLNKDAYHIQLFHEKFDHAPTFDEVKDLNPFVWHAPIAIADLLARSELTLIGHKALDEQALAGYEEYLHQMGESQPVVDEMLERLKGFSNQGPMKLRFTKSGGQFVISVLE